MNENQKREFEMQKKRALKLKRRLDHEVSKTHRDNPKIRRIKGQLSRRIEKMDSLDNGYRIGSGIIPDNWDGR